MVESSIEILSYCLYSGCRELVEMNTVNGSSKNRKEILDKIKSDFQPVGKSVVEMNTVNRSSKNRKEILEKQKVAFVGSYIPKC